MAAAAVGIAAIPGMALQADEIAGARSETQVEGRLDLAAEQDAAKISATEDAGTATPIFRGVAEDHIRFEHAQQGTAYPGDPLGHTDTVAHNLGFTTDSRFTSWTTDRSMAGQFAGKNGVILHTTVEEMQSRGVNIVSSPDIYGESELFLEGIIGNLGMISP